MLLAIDVGNTDLKFGVLRAGDLGPGTGSVDSGLKVNSSDSGDPNRDAPGPRSPVPGPSSPVPPSWLTIWRRPSTEPASADELVAWLHEMLEQAQIPGEIHAVACCSVVPAWDPTLRRLARLLCDADIFFLRTGDQVGVKVNYDPPSSLGADRVANVLGALKQHKPPVIVIDFGSATTLDVITDAGFVGGAILPGVAIQAEAISRRAAQLPKVPLSVPHKVIANNTMEALQAGIILGHVSAIEGLVARIKQELGTPATVVATGGLSHLFMGATPAIHHFVPQLTLDGIAAAYHDQHLTADPG